MTRIHICWESGSCEITPPLFETFAGEQSCLIEQEPFVHTFVQSLLRNERIRTRVVVTAALLNKTFSGSRVAGGRRHPQ